MLKILIVLTRFASELVIKIKKIKKNTNKLDRGRQNDFKLLIRNIAMPVTIKITLQKSATDVVVPKQPINANKASNIHFILN